RHLPQRLPSCCVHAVNILRSPENNLLATFRFNDHRRAVASGVVDRTPFLFATCAVKGDETTTVLCAEVYDEAFAVDDRGSGKAPLGYARAELRDAIVLPDNFAAPGVEAEEVPDCAECVDLAVVNGGRRSGAVCVSSERAVPHRVLVRPQR